MSIYGDIICPKCNDVQRGANYMSQDVHVDCVKCEAKARKEKAWVAGYDDGAEGYEEAVPLAYDDMQAAAYQRGWMDGQADRKHNLGED